jgi:hypothetical protein
MIRDTDLLFSKKLTTQEKEFEPRRLRRIIRKFIKKIKPGERIMFVGLSAQPYRARIKLLLQIYEHMILFPRPNYGSRRSKHQPYTEKKQVFFVFFIGIFYEILIEKHNLNINDVELSILASISKGYTAGQILETIEKVIRTKQETKYSNNLYTANDFIPTLGLKSPVFIDEENKIKVRNQHFLFLLFIYITKHQMVLNV